jgi:hypothetical protein
MFKPFNRYPSTLLTRSNALRVAVSKVESVRVLRFSKDAPFKPPPLSSPEARGRMKEGA